MNRTTDKPMPAAPPETGEIVAPREEGLLRRWSRRKTQERQETPPPAPADAEETGVTEPPVPGNPPDVPSRSRRALQRLFHSGMFNERCPLDSEFYDFRGEEPLGSVITHEMREEMERAAAAIRDQSRRAVLEPDKPAAGPAASGPEPATNPTAAASAPDPGAVKEG